MTKINKDADMEEFLDDLWKEYEKELLAECDCGAPHTSFPNKHYDWCQIVRKRNNSND